METMIIKGELIRERIFTEVRTEISELRTIHHSCPGVAFIAFNGIPLGKYNIPLHVSSAESLGFKVILEMMTETTQHWEVVELIHRLNEDDDVHAIVIL